MLVVAVKLAKVFMEVISLLIEKRQQVLVILITQTEVMKIIFLQIYQFKLCALRMMVKTVIVRVS